MSVLVVTHLEAPTVAVLARAIVTAMPRAADTVADFPLLLAVRDFDDVANVFVAETFDLPFEKSRQYCVRSLKDEKQDVCLRWTHVAIEDVVIAVADTTGEDFHENLAFFQLGHGKVLDLERLLLSDQDGRLVAVGKAHCCCNVPL